MGAFLARLINSKKGRVRTCSRDSKRSLPRKGPLCCVGNRPGGAGEEAGGAGKGCCSHQLRDPAGLGAGEGVSSGRILDKSESTDLRVSGWIRCGV